jgi:transposase-like protein
MALPKIYSDEDAARKHLEALQWPEGVVCPHCGNVDQARIKSLQGKSTRPGVYKCNECRKPFSVTVGTVFERSHIPLHKWLYATHLMTASKKGISAHQLHRTLEVTYKSAWFMAHRIREAMADNVRGPMGGEGQIVEADETYFGPVAAAKVRGKTTTGRKFTKGGRSGPSNKRPIVSLVERGGRVRSFHIASADKENVQSIVLDNIDRESRLHTDESKLYHGAALHFASHETVKHSAKEYVRGDVHTNSAEGYFSIFKRGMRGVYQHCKEKHLHRYLAEFDFRYNNRIALGVNDTERADNAAKAIRGKRLTYRRTNEALV